MRGGVRTEVLSAILPVIVLLLIGVFCKRVRLVSPQGIADMKSLIANILLPVTLVNALGNANHHKRIIVFLFASAASF